MKTFFLILSITFAAADLFVWWRGARLLDRCKAPQGVRLFFHLFLALQTGLLLFIFGSRILGISPDPYVPTAALIAVFLWHPFILPVLVLLYALGWLQSGLLALFRRLRRASPRPEPAEGTPETLPMTRRQFLGSAAALTPPLLTLFLTGIAARQLDGFRIRRITVTLPQLPQGLDGMTIAHLSDTHVGRFTHGGLLQKMAETTNALNPDLVVFTGDLLNDSLEWLPEARALLEAIDRPVYLCEGNHDRIDSTHRFREAMRAIPNVRFLLQQAETLELRGERVQILGSAWDRTNNPALTEELEALRDPEAFTLYLVHHPHSWDHPHQFDLTLAGHTHGGQLMLTEKIGPGPKMFRYWSGLYERTGAKGKQALVVSNGIGNWFPLRVNAPAELVFLTLRRA